MNKHLLRGLLAGASLIAAAPAVFAVPDASGEITSTPAPDISQDAAMSARLNYNVGFEQFEKAQAAEKAAASLSGAKARTAREAVLADYRAARERFDAAAKADPNMKEAWNLVGYTSRRVGELDRSLDAYGKALALDPDYAEAIEYRAEAYLTLNRLDDAKSAYLSLFAAHPAHAGVLLESMRNWVADKQKSPGAVSKADVDAFAAWVAERGSLAAQTAALRDVSGSVQRWN